MLKRFFYFSCIVFSVSACASPMRNIETESGFLGGPADYDALQFDSRVGMFKYLKSEKALVNYRAYSVAPVKIMTTTFSEVRVEEREVEKLADEFRGEIIRALGSSYSQLNTPARDKAEIRIALTGVEPNSLVGSLRPGILVKRSGLGGATMEAEIVDSVSGRRVAAFMDSRSGENSKYFEGLTKWGSSDEAFRSWAGLVKRFIRKEG